MRDDADPAEPADVLDRGPRLAAQRIRGRGRAEGDVVAAPGADLDRVEHQHAVDVGGRIGGRAFASP